MTTTYTGPTPYDAAERNNEQSDESYQYFRGAQEGYRRKAAEDAPLLEAAKAALEALAVTAEESSSGSIGTARTRRHAKRLLRLAIAKAEGRTP